MPVIFGQNEVHIPIIKLTLIRKIGLRSLILKILKILQILVQTIISKLTSYA